MAPIQYRFFSSGQEERMDQALKNCDLFAHMTADEARLCLGCSGAVEEKYGRGGMVFCETDTPTRLFVLLEGSVTVGRDSADGRRAVMARIGSPGDLFGEVYVFLDQTTYGCSVQAESPVRVLAIPAKFFYSTCEKRCAMHAQIIRNMLSVFARKAFFLTRRVSLLSSGSLRRKIAALLLEHRAPDGSVNLGMNREQMADFLGVTRPSLSRELAAMRDEGLLDIRGKTIALPHPERLKEFYDYFVP